MSKRKNHPYADLFPMMTAAELDALAADVKENGLHHPIVLYQEQILDGRNRLLACEQAGVDPRFEEHAGDDASALALVISLNVQRRDLTAAQRAIVAARCMDHTRQLSRDGRKTVAKTFKVGENSVQQAKALLSESADLASQVESCNLSLALAYEQLQQRRKDVKQKEKDSLRVAEYKDAVSSGDMTFEEAMGEALQQEREEKERVAQESQARQLWLGKLLEFVRWVEDSVATRTDEHLSWYAEDETPDLAADRVEAAIAQLLRIHDITFGGNHDSRTTNARESKAGGAKARPPAA